MQVAALKIAVTSYEGGLLHKYQFKNDENGVTFRPPLNMVDVFKDVMAYCADERNGRAPFHQEWLEAICASVEGRNKARNPQGVEATFENPNSKYRVDLNLVEGLALAQAALYYCATGIDLVPDNLMRTGPQA